MFYHIRLYIFFLYSVQSEYQIKKNVVPTYLYKEFHNLTENIFPNDITINITLTEAEGTLLYSLDSNNNQLIVTLNSHESVSLDIEFNKEHYYVSLRKLCELEWCKYTNLLLRIRLKDDMSVQCNQRKFEYFKYIHSQKLNRDYPIVKFNKTDKLSAHLWLVNNPEMNGIYPNQAQLAGCIFGVSYKKVPLQMESHNTGNKCPITCSKDICNTGSCLETHNNRPLCNCTASFQNGLYCNDTLNYHWLSMKHQFAFRRFKMSFNSSFDDIFTMSSKKVSISVVADGTNLRFIINCTKLYPTKIESIISQYYRKNQKYIIITEFGEKSLDVKLSNISHWSNISIPHGHNLERETYGYFHLCGGDGGIDVGYKNNIDDVVWINLPSAGEYNTGDTCTKVTETPQNITTISSAQSTTPGDTRKSLTMFLDTKSTVQSFFYSRRLEESVYTNFVLSIAILILAALMIVVMIWARLFVSKTGKKRSGSIQNIFSAIKSKCCDGENSDKNSMTVYIPNNKDNNDF